MKYVLLFGGTMEPEERAKDPEMAAAYERITKWFDDYGRAGKIISGQQRQGTPKGTTVRCKDGKPMVVDGPFIEAKEVIGGFAVLEVADLDEAVAVAKTGPGHTVVQVTPIADS